MYRVYRLREGGTASIVDVAPNVVAELSYRISESRDSNEVSSMDEKINILMVDDKPGKLLSYEAILNELGEKLIKAHSGRAALEHLLKTDVAVVRVSAPRGAYSLNSERKESSSTWLSGASQ
jgi:hypothetical protein